MAKRLLSALLIVVMTLAMIPAMDGQNKAEAATAGINNNGLYTIVSAYNGKALTQTDMSTFWANAVVWNTNAMSDLARWTLTERGEFYSMTNVVSGKSMKICGTTAGSNCDFNGYDNSNDYKWKIVPITSGTYAGCFYIVSSRKTNDNQELYVEVREANNDRNDGAQVGLYTKAPTESDRQIWRIQSTTRTDETFTLDKANTMLDAFKNKYFKYRSESGKNTLGWGFWSVAEVMEAMLDGYELTGNPQYREMFQGTWDSFLVKNGENWSWNAYNDDITWAALTGCRAYMLFGGQKYLDIAKTNFDLMYDRASTFEVNGVRTGVLRWCEENGRNTSSNGCINGPAIVCACHLAIATGDNGYWDKAKRIYEAQRNSNLYVADGSDAGWVRDCINQDGSVANYWCSTYNQGTYLGSAVMLYNHFGDQKYATDADNIVKYTLDHLCYNRILKEENTNEGDLSGFRGILVRYMRMYILERDKNDYLDFFTKNATIAWMNRNSQNIQQCSWQKKTSEDANWDEFAGYNAVCVAANMPTYRSTIDRSAYERIEAEDMDYTRGLIAEGSSGTSGGRSLGGVQNGHYTAYYNVDFGSTGASSVNFNYSKANEGANATVEFRLDSKDGEVIASASIEPTGNWSTWRMVSANTTRKVTGKHKVYVMFNSPTSYVCNLDYFQFDEYTVDGFSTIKATDLDDRNGLVIDKDGSGNPSNLGGVTNGTWALYKSLNFGNTNAVSIEFNYASKTNDAEGKIEIYADDLNSNPIGSINMPNTGSDWNTYKTVKTNLTTQISGKHNIYIKFVTTSNKAYVCNLKSFRFSRDVYIEPTTEAPTEPETEAPFAYDVPMIEGFQISTSYEGTRVVGAIEKSYNGKNVTSYGFIFGLAGYDGSSTGIKDSDMVRNNDTDCIKTYQSTAKGTLSYIMGDSDSATYVACTMSFGAKNMTAFTAQYKVRAYAVLSDGSVVYSDVENYSVYSVADYVYSRKLMNNVNNHNYLYNTILKFVNPSYKEIAFDWNGTLVD